MATVLKGSDTANAISNNLIQEIELLSNKGIVPTLAIVRVGDKPDAIAYEQNAIRRCQKLGLDAYPVTFSLTVSEEELIQAIYDLNQNNRVHGVLLLRPLPAHINEDNVRQSLDPEKDVDGITDISLYGVFAGVEQGFPPCTAQACIEILKNGNIELKGKRVVIVGASLVIGRPVAMLFLKNWSTVTLCHIETVDLAAACRNAEILVVATGCQDLIGREHLSPGQIVIDVGISVDPNGGIHGDVQPEAENEIVTAYTPVPGGVGAVTTTVLAKHVVQAALRRQN